MTTTKDTSEASRLRRWAILTAMLLGTMLAILDSSILNILAVPIMGEFQASLRIVESVLRDVPLGAVRPTLGRYLTSGYRSPRRTVRIHDRRPYPRGRMASR